MIESIEVLKSTILQNKSVLFAIGAFSIVTFVGSLIAIPVLVVNMHADYFETKRKDTHDRSQAFNVFAIVVIVLKNIIGYCLLFAGILMLVLPGQGIITILIGISMLNFPGKRRLEVSILRLSAVHKTIDWMRARAGKEPIILPKE